jgi:hypothetical protein
MRRSGIMDSGTLLVEVVSGHPEVALQEFVMSLSLGSGALVVAALSGLVSCASYFVRSRLFQGLIALLPPCVIAYSLYWTPVWCGKNASEYWSWAPLLIVPWSGAGLMVSVLMYNYIWKPRQRLAG